GDPEVDPRARAFLLHLRDAAEHPQVDAHDPDSVAQRHDGVAELVQDDRDEQQQHAYGREHERLAVLAREDVVVVLREPPDEEEDDQEPARVHTDPDPEDPRYLDGAPTEHMSMVAYGFGVAAE